MVAESTIGLNFGVAMLWLGGAIWFARWNRPDEPAAYRRVPLTTLAFVGGLAVSILILILAIGGAPEAGPLFLGGILIVGLATFFSAVLIDAAAVALGAMRTPQWLAAGIVLAILATCCWLSILANWLSDGRQSLGQFFASPFFLTPVIIAVSAALVWWSELPRPEGGD